MSVYRTCERILTALSGVEGRQLRRQGGLSGRRRRTHRNIELTNACPGVRHRWIVSWSWMSACVDGVRSESRKMRERESTRTLVHRERRVEADLERRRVDRQAAPGKVCVVSSSASTPLKEDEGESGAPSPSLSGGTTSPSLSEMSKLVKRFSAEMLQPYSGMPVVDVRVRDVLYDEEERARERTVVHDPQKPARPLLLGRDEEEVVDVAEQRLRRRAESVLHSRDEEGKEERRTELASSVKPSLVLSMSA